MIDLATATSEVFASALAQRFRIDVVDGEALELELLQVDKRGAFDPQVHKRQAFSLIFRGPADRVLPQRIHALSNEALGTLEIFLVPIGPDKTGMRYEAIFT